MDNTAIILNNRPGTFNIFCTEHFRLQGAPAYRYLQHLQADPSLTLRDESLASSGYKAGLQKQWGYRGACPNFCPKGVKVK